MRRIALSADSRLVASISDADRVVVSRTSTLKQVASLNIANPLGVAWSHEDAHVLVATPTELCVLDSGTLASSRTVNVDLGQRLAEKLHPGFATITGAGEIDVGASGSLVLAAHDRILLLGPDFHVRASYPQLAPCRVRLSPAEDAIYAASGTGPHVGVWCWEIATGKGQRLEGTGDEPIYALDIDRETGAIAAGGLHAVYLWDA